MKDTDVVYGRLTKADVDAIMKSTIDQIRTASGKNKGLIWTEEKEDMRRRYILHYCAKGMTTSNIVNNLIDSWEIKKAVAKEYVKDAYHQMMVEAAEFKESDRDKIITQLEDIAEECRGRGDAKGAVKALDMVAKLKGMNVDKIEVKADETIRFDFGNN